MTNKNTLFKPTAADQAKQKRYEDKKSLLGFYLERDIKNDNEDERTLRIGLTYVLLNLNNISTEESMERLNHVMKLFKEMIKGGQWIIKKIPNLNNIDFSSQPHTRIIDRIDKIMEKVDLLKTYLSLGSTTNVSFEKFIELIVILPLKHLAFLKADDRCWLVMALLSPYFDEYEPFDCNAITAVLELLDEKHYRQKIIFPDDKFGPPHRKYLTFSKTTGGYASVDWLEYATRLRKNSAAWVISEHAKMVADPESKQIRLIAENKFYSF